MSHKHYEIQHRYDRINKAQVGFFEQKITEARNLKPTNHDVGLAHIECDYAGIHIVVMADDMDDAAYALAQEVSEVVIATR